MNMHILDTLGVSLLGMCVVFIVLIILMCVIYIMTAVMRRESKPALAPAVAALQAVIETPETPAAAPARGSCGVVSLYDVPDPVAAQLMAIVADELKTPLNELRFISIREVEE